MATSRFWDIKINHIINPSLISLCFSLQDVLATSVATSILGQTIRCYCIPPELETYSIKDKSSSCVLSQMKSYISYHHQVYPRSSLTCTIVMTSHPVSLLLPLPLVYCPPDNWSGPFKTWVRPEPFFVRNAPQALHLTQSKTQSPYNELQALTLYGFISPLSFFITASPFTLSTPDSWPPLTTPDWKALHLFSAPLHSLVSIAFLT